MSLPLSLVPPTTGTSRPGVFRSLWLWTLMLLMLGAGPALAQGRWEVVTGPPGPGLKQVAVANKQLIYGLDTAGTLWSWNGSGWDKRGCCVNQISVGSDGTLWATDPPDQMRVLRWRP